MAYSLKKCKFATDLNERTTMDFADIIRMKNGKEAELTQSATTVLCVEMRENKRCIVKRQLPRLCGEPGYAGCYQKEYELGRTLKHPNLLAYGEQDDDGGIVMERGAYITLEQLLFDNPAFITRTGDIERIIGEILNALNYLHSQGIYQYDLTPRTILLTKSGYTVKLIGAASYYTPIRKAVWKEKNDYMAPELQEDNPCLNARTDIYAVGKVLETIFSYSSMPYRYSGVIRKATQVDPMRRYATIQSLKNAVTRRANWQKTRRSIGIILAVCLVAGAGIWYSNEITEEVQFIRPAQNSTHTFDSIQSRVEQFALEALSDSLTLEERKILQDSIYRKANDIFRRQFRKQATPVISRIYNQQLLNGTEDNFQTAVMQGYEDLNRIKQELIEQNEMDAITADRIASEVINEITQDKMKSLKELQQDR